MEVFFTPSFCYHIKIIDKTMDKDIQNQLDDQNAKLDAIYVSVEKTRKYFLVVMWVSLAVILLPAIGLLFVIPAFIDTYASLDGLL